MSLLPRSLPGLAAGAMLFLAAFPPPAPAGDASREGAWVNLVLKDGFVLQGKVRREGKDELLDDQVIFIPSGFFFLDDMRRQYFSPSLMGTPPHEIPEPPEPLRRENSKKIITEGKPLPVVDEILSAGSFDENWDRTVKYRSGLKTLERRERVVELTPYYTRAQSLIKYNWPIIYMTRELGPAVVRTLLSSHPDFTQDPKLSPEVLADHRFRYAAFMAEAGFFDEAEAELGRLLDDKPADQIKKQADEKLAAIKMLRRREEFEAIKRMHNAGQFETVRKKLADFDDKSADPQTAAKANELRDSYKAADAATADVKRFLDELPPKLCGGDEATALTEAAVALRDELQPDTLPRLDSFLGQARQADRQAKLGQAPSKTPAQLLSLAVTGWLGVLPDDAPARAVRLWRARLFLQNYFGPNVAGRKALLENYQKASGDMAPLDDIVRIIPHLPPPEPEQTLGPNPLTLTVGDAKNAAPYLVQLPPEYRHSRNCPVLFVLHQASEPPKEMLDRWSDLAAQNGYILVAPEWSQKGASSYGYSVQEQAAVVDVLRDLRRRFAVDSDRVFLFGSGAGGAMAFDVGLSHPDLFAGVLPMSAPPLMFAEHYFTNGQLLPFYIVSGDRSGKDGFNKELRAQFNLWVNQYPMIWIQYKGRGVEWFGAELPNMFDWMRTKKRQFPLEGLGWYKDPDTARKDFVTHRATDNSFYWITTDGIDPKCIKSETTWKLDGRLPAKLEAKIDLAKNTILVDTNGLTQITLWLGTDGEGTPLINFDKPLTVHWARDGAGADVWKDRVVARSLQTLVEDVAARGDRQRLFTAKMEFSK